MKLVIISKGNNSGLCMYKKIENLIVKTMDKTFEISINKCINLK